MDHKQKNHTFRHRSDRCLIYNSIEGLCHYDYAKEIFSSRPNMCQRLEIDLGGSLIKEDKHETTGHFIWFL